MKKLLLVSTIAALSAATAQAAPNVSGVLGLALNLNTVKAEKTDIASKVTSKDESEINRVELQSVSTGVRFFGNEKLNDDLDLVYSIRTYVRADGSKDNKVSTGDVYLGLDSKQYGSIKAGRQWSIEADYAGVLPLSILDAPEGMYVYDGDRYNNAFKYKAPKINDLELSGFYALEEGKKDNRIIMLTAEYEPEGAPYKGGATYARLHKSNIARITGAYEVMPNVTVGGLYQRSRLKEDDVSENAFTVSVEYDIEDSPWLAYSQLDIAHASTGAENNNKQRISVGAKYEFNKNLTGNVYASTVNAKYTKEAEKDAKVAVTPTYTHSFKGAGVGASIVYKF